ncbi:hypothetical protein ACG873_01020 (plasmid) [Mesorhizobium sp. AaZ16]|uniref:hypothetical protein n=1 Tax=Mesorhizobium sp. AaZ16 TaxID=3402289 RepID=UPI00374F5909
MESLAPGLVVLLTAIAAVGMRSSLKQMLKIVGDAIVLDPGRNRSPYRIGDRRPRICQR